MMKTKMRTTTRQNEAEDAEGGREERREKRIGKWKMNLAPACFFEYGELLRYGRGSPGELG